MAGIIDYDNLCQAVEEWLARGDLTENVKDFIWLAECDIQRTVRFRDPQDKTVTGDTIDGEQWITLPDDYAEGGRIRWTSPTNLPAFEVGSIDQVDLLQRQTTRAQVGLELRLGFLWGNRVYIGPTPGAASYELFYHSGVQHLSSKNGTNLILREYPDTLLYGALVTAAPFLGADERVQVWAQFYQNAKEETRQAEWRARTGHGSLRMRYDAKVI